MITGGHAFFEQSRKLAEFENRKAAISFNVTEETGAEAEAQRALDLATKLVFDALGLTKPTVITPAPAVDPKLPRKPKGGKVDTEAAGIKNTLAKADPTAVTDDKPQISVNPEDRKAPDDDPAAVTDELDPLTADDPEVTDQVLTETITRKNQELIKAVTAAGKDKAEAPKMIRQLIGKYVSGGGQAAQMPKEARSKFMKELAALTA